MSLKCTGKGFLRGVPRRNLNDKEVEQYGGEEFLLSTGLYFKETDKREGQLPAAPEKPKRKKGKRDNTLTEG